MTDYFEESIGLNNLTSQEPERNLSARQVIVILGENGDLQKAVNEIYKNRAEDDPTTEFIPAYTSLKYLLRWDAEKEGM